MKIKYQKGQISMEFLVIIGLILVIFLAILFYSIERKNEVLKTDRLLKADSECMKIADLISEAYMNSEGTRVEVSTSYFVSISNRSQLDVSEKGNSEIKSLCSFYAKSLNYNSSGDFIIKNDKNVIIYENA